MTLVEVMVVVVLLGAVGGTVMSVLAKQQAFYRSTADIMELRSQLRQGSAVLAADLRGIATGSNDIYSMTDTTIEFRSNLGNSIVCTVNSGVGQVTLPPLGELNRGNNTLTQWISRPQRGDSIYIYSDPDTLSGSDDTWELFKLDTLIASVNACSTGSSVFTSGADANLVSYTVQVNSGGSPISSAVRQGATVRFARRVRYAVYQGPDGWYLGYCAPTCASTALQPIAGPFYAAAGSTANSVLKFTYYDVNGSVTATANQVAQISFVLNGRTRVQINISGMGKDFYKDSLRTNVAIRNRS